MKNIAVLLFAAALLLAGGIFLQAHTDTTAEKKFIITGNAGNYCSVYSSAVIQKNEQNDIKNGLPVKKRKPGERRPVKLSIDSQEKRKATNLPYKPNLQSVLLTWQ